MKPDEISPDRINAANADAEAGCEDAYGQSSFAPPVSQEEIFRQLIEDELKEGRLTRSRRKRIVRYAVHLRLSAIQVGRMIQDGRRKALDSDDPAVRRHALKLVEPPPERIPVAWKISAVIALAIVADLIVIALIGS